MNGEKAPYSHPAKLSATDRFLGRENHCVSTSCAHQAPMDSSNPGTHKWSCINWGTKQNKKTWM